MMYVLICDGKAIAAAERMERLNEAMTAYTSARQLLMHIDAVEVLR